MKYHIILALEVTADPGDIAGAARKGFDALAQQFNTNKPIKLKILMQDGSEEAELLPRILKASFGAQAPVSFT